MCSRSGRVFAKARWPSASIEPTRRPSPLLSPLRPVGAPSALESVGLLAVQMWPVSEWRLTFAQPLREPITLETSCELSGRALPTEALCHLTPLAARELLPALILVAAADLSFGAFTRQWDWEVPLAFLKLPHRTTGEVNLRLASPNLVQVRSAGLWE